MKVIKLIIVAISCLLIGASPQSLSLQCINSLPDDSDLFGASLAMSNNYLAVGDPGANRVVIFGQYSNGKWSRTKEILPPKDSIFSKYNSGFAKDISLDENTLAVVALTNKIGYKSSLFRTIYQVNIEKNTIVKQIDTSVEEFFGERNIVTDNGTIAFIASEKKVSGERVSKVSTISANKKNLDYILDKQNYTFVDLALKNNWLLVSYLSDPGGAWLVNLEQPNKNFNYLNTENNPYPVSIAISDRFAAVSLFSGNITYDTNPQTIVKAINNDSIVTVDGSGKLSLDGNILSRLKSFDPFFNWQPNILELFYIDENATPHLFKKRQPLQNIENALVKNSLLITVQKKASGKKLCIEPVF